MAKEKENRKKEKKEKEARKEKKRRKAEELAVKEKKISKKRKLESKKSEKPEKSKKKSKKPEVEEEKPQKKSKETKKKKQKIPDESEDPQSQILLRPDDSHHHVTAPIHNEADSDFELDKEDVKHLLESYSKEELISLIYKTAEKGSRLISAVLESADRDSAKRNIFVRGLGWDTTHENLKAAFEIYGEIEECSVVMDKDTGRAKGYGFVMFKTRKGAREALRNPEKRMYNRTVSCNLAAAKPSGAGKQPPREPVESVKIDLTRSEVAAALPLPPPPGIDLTHGLDNGHQHQNMPMFGAQNMPFYGHGQPPGFNPMYGALMANQMAANYRMFGTGMMNPGPMMPLPPNHVGMAAGQYVGDGNGVGPGPGFEGDHGWYR